MRCSKLLLVVTFLLRSSVCESCSQKVGVVACENFVAKLQCDHGRVISVQQAYYGRLDKTTCISGRPVNQIQNVHCTTTSSKVAESCNGKSGCSIMASNSVFGDPCYGTYKYLKVVYTCQLLSPCVPIVACEGSVAQLTCGPGQVIKVNSGAYGRRDRTTCIAGRPASQIQNVSCSSSTDKVEKSCNGKRTCAIAALNSVFGDPCVGTYKYLKVDYICYAQVTG